jgi:hypothetical protein
MGLMALLTAVGTVELLRKQARGYFLTNQAMDNSQL